MPHIASTLTHDVKYTFWTSNPGGINTKREINGKNHILIKGGHGVAQRDAAGGLHTPDGVITTVTEDELKLLEADEVFQTHLKNGCVKVLKQNTAPEKAAKDMSASKDAPLTPKDFEKGGRVAVPDSMKVNGGKKLQ